MSFQFSSVKCAVKYCMVSVKTALTLASLRHFLTKAGTDLKSCSAFNEYKMNSDGDTEIDYFNIVINGSRWMWYIGMRIHLVPLIMGTDWCFIKGTLHFCSASSFDLKNPRNILLQGHAVQQEPCRHQPLQGVVLNGSIKVMAGVSV